MARRKTCGWIVVASGISMRISNELELALPENTHGSERVEHVETRLWLAFDLRKFENFANLEECGIKRNGFVNSFEWLDFACLRTSYSDPGEQKSQIRGLSRG